MLANYLLKMIRILIGIKLLLPNQKSLCKNVVEQDARLSVKDVAGCSGILEGSLQTIPKRRLLYGYFICSLKVKGTKALNVSVNSWKSTRDVIGVYFELCFSHREELIISNWSESLKRIFTVMRWVANLVGQMFKCRVHIWKHSHWTISKEICFEESEKEFTTRNDQARMIRASS